MKEKTFRALRADEIELRVGTVGKQGFSLLCYKDSRCDMNILDETFGMFGWQRDHKEIKGNLYCGVGIYNDIEWVWKWDCGTESYTEKEKGEASDSFKRACFNLGIGRELYTSPFIWISGHLDDKGKPDQKFVGGLRVAKVEYDESTSRRTIKKLVITDKDGNMVFVYGAKGESNKVPKDSTEKKKLTRAEMGDILIDLCDKKRFRVSDICAKSGVEDLDGMTEEQISKWIDWLVDK